MKNKNVVSGIDSLCAVGLITNFNYIQSVYAHLKKSFMLCYVFLCFVMWFSIQTVLNAMLRNMNEMLNDIWYGILCYEIWTNTHLHLSTEEFKTILK